MRFFLFFPMISRCIFSLETILGTMRRQCAPFCRPSRSTVSFHRPVCFLLFFHFLNRPGPLLPDVNVLHLCCLLFLPLVVFCPPPKCFSGLSGGFFCDSGPTRTPPHNPLFSWRPLREILFWAESEDSKPARPLSWPESPEPMRLPFHAHSPAGAGRFVLIHLRGHVPPFCWRLAPFNVRPPRPFFSPWYFSKPLLK